MSTFSDKQDRHAEKPPAGGGTPAGRPADAIRSSRDVRVLIIDDDATICEMLEAFLVGEGFKTAVVQNPSDLVQRIGDETFHVILLDYVIPGMEFEQLLETVRSQWADACVIVITGYPSVEGAVACIRYHVFDYLIKPFGVDDVRAAMSRALRFKGLERLSPKILQRSIGKKIRGARKAKGLTLGNLASRTNLSIGFLSQIELGKNSASVDTLYRIATALGLHPGVFFDGLNGDET